MMKRELLRQYRSIKLEIIQLENERRDWRERAGKHVRNPDSLGIGNGFNDPLPVIMDRLDEVELMLNKRVEQLCALRLEIESAIENMEGFERLLMRAHYIENKTWEAVADELGYSWRWINKLHAKALNKLESSSYKEYEA